MDRLLTMAAFIKVVQTGSFTVAATDLGISRALVSRYVADLEEHIGIRLLHRTTRHIELTDKGGQYFEFCKNILEEIRTEEDKLSRVQRVVEGRISVACPKWIGFTDLPDALAAFCSLNSRIRCDLSLVEASTRTQSFLERGYDLAILTRSVRDSGVKVKKLANIGYVVAAAPRYLAERGVPEHPRELSDHACVVQVSDPIWRFKKGKESTSIKVHPRFTSNTYTVLSRAAIGGLGIALLPERLVLPHVESGQLQLVLEKFSVEDRPLYAAFSPGGAPPQKLRSLLNFLSHWFRHHPLKSV